MKKHYKMLPYHIRQKIYRQIQLEKYHNHMSKIHNKRMAKLKKQNQLFLLSMYEEFDNIKKKQYMKSTN